MGGGTFIADRTFLPSSTGREAGRAPSAFRELNSLGGVRLLQRGLPPRKER